MAESRTQVAIAVLCDARHIVPTQVCLGVHRYDDLEPESAIAPGS
jgi:hypothetical protein